MRLRIHSPLVKVAALITLGSGLLNLRSLIGPSLPNRVRVLSEIFPLEFIHLSKFLILIIGFALVISALNIYKRKRRAFQIVLVLAAGSVVFHLTKGLDYEEAAVSLLVLIALLAAGKNFTVKSSVINLPQSVGRLAIAFLIALAYGTAGFWFLEHHHFKMNFHLGDALGETLRYMSLVGDPDLVPYTRYARWFMDSLYVMTMTAIGYAILVLYRPILYRFRLHDRELGQARTIVEAHGRCATDYFKYWPDKSWFFSRSLRSVIAYSVGRNFALALADPVGPEEEIEEIIRDFQLFCQDNDWGIGFHQTLPDFLPIYEKLEFRKLKIGDEAVTDLRQFTLDGKERKTLRHTVNKLADSGNQFAHHAPPISEEIMNQLEKISDDWLRLSGHRERGFTLGKFERRYIQSTPVCTATDQHGVIQAFVNLIPSYQPGEATIDLMRRRGDSPNGIMDFLFVKLLLHLAELGYQRFSLGLAPMSGFRGEEKATAEEKAIHFFFQRLNFLFSYRGLYHYKAKFASFWEPRYAIYRNPLDLPRMALAFSKVSEFRD